jgi:hypothetical protein
MKFLQSFKLTSAIAFVFLTACGDGSQSETAASSKKISPDSFSFLSCPGAPTRQWSQSAYQKTCSEPAKKWAGAQKLFVESGAGEESARGSILTDKDIYSLYCASMKKISQGNAAEQKDFPEITRSEAKASLSCSYKFFVQEEEQWVASKSSDKIGYDSGSKGNVGFDIISILNPRNSIKGFNDRIPGGEDDGN